MLVVVVCMEGMAVVGVGIAPEEDGMDIMLAICPETEYGALRWRYTRRDGLEESLYLALYEVRHCGCRRRMAKANARSSHCRSRRTENLLKRTQHHCKGVPDGE